MNSDPRALPSAEEVSGRILHWLLDGPAVLREEPWHGAVCGWLDRHGPVFVYPEVAGYFLTALAAVHCSHPLGRSRAAARAASIHGWLDDQVRRHGVPDTRIYLRPHAGDWRIRRRFAFDLAMIARGLAMARPLLPAGTRLLQRVLLALEDMVDAAGDFAASRPLPGAMAAPAAWSTTAGFFMMKVAAALHSCVPLPPRLAHACDKITARWADVPEPTGPLHPYLYGLEGCAMLALSRADRRLLARTSAACRRVLATVAAESSAPSDAGARVDVVAQVLRLASCFAHRADRAVRCALADWLGRRVGADGGVPFRDRDPAEDRQRCVWAALFAWQGLALHERCERGEPTLPRLAALV